MNTKRPATRPARTRGAAANRATLDAQALLRIQRDLGIALSTASDLRAALRRLLSACVAVEGIDGGGVYLLHRAEERVDLVAHRGLSRQFVAAVGRFSLSTPLVRRVLGGRSVYRSYAQVRANPLFADEGLLSVAGFPIRYSRDIIAIVNVASRTCRRIPRFTRTVLAAIAAQVANVVPRIRAETEWREAQRNLQSLLATTSDFLFIADERGCIVEVNDAVLSLLGYAREELLGRPVATVHPPAMQDEVAALIADMLSGRATECLIPLRTRGGDDIPVETRVTRARWGGRPVLFGIARDVRERQRLEQEIVRISEAEKARIAQDIHDNLMQQLAGIGMLTAAFRKQAAVDTAGAQETAERIHELTRELLTTARRSIQGFAPVAPIEGGIERALQRLARDAATRCNCACRARCRMDIADLDPAQSTQLYYIAQESIRNAAAHGKATRIEVTLNVDGDVGSLVVTDNGCGIEPRPDPYAGMGLRIMACRAGVIAGRLTVGPRRQGGTRVQCAFRPKPAV